MTILEGNIEEIIKINKQRWEIEENFRIMKTEFEARPVYVRRDDRIKAHFMTSYISLPLYRLLEKNIGNRYTAEQIIETLRSKMPNPVRFLIIIPMKISPFLLTHSFRHLKTVKNILQNTIS